MTQPVWQTPVGSIGTFPSGLPLIYQFNANPASPATSVTYAFLSGAIPTGLTISSTGLLRGTPGTVTKNFTNTFAVRATDNLGNIRDRTFNITISGSAIPSISTPGGVLLNTLDSVWIDLDIQYVNPDPNNEVIFNIKDGTLPPGLEMDYLGNIRGYPNPPTTNVTLPPIVTTATSTSDANNTITCLTTNGFLPGRPIVFSGTSVLGGIEADVTYYIKDVLSSTNITISTTQFGTEFFLFTDTGFMTVTASSVSVGQPAIRTYSFTVQLRSLFGNDSAAYTITVTNQNLPVSQGGPGNPPNNRIPTILNTRPLTFALTEADPYYGYYILPPVPPTSTAFIGTAQSGDFFAFKAIGYDFDGNGISYAFSGLPSSLVGDSATGWITGTPTLSSVGINNYNFSVAVYKTANPDITTPYYNFSVNLSKDVTGVITWITPSDLGTVFNETISTLSVVAVSDIELQYRITNGILPPNLILLSNGEITGYVANQPTSEFLEVGATTNFEFTVEAYNPSFNVVTSSKTFNITVEQQYSQPTDILYIKAAPSVEDRQIIDTLLDNEVLIPTNMLYRPDDVYFGKSTSIVYEHAFGIYSSNVQEYIAAVTLNHYWRNITLGAIKTAVARNDAGDIVYEVVYSEVIDNLVNPKGVSTPAEIYWPRPIDLGQGPWYTSVTNIFSSYELVLGQEYYTSLTPGYVRLLYPNSLYNMRNRVAQVLGQEYDSRLLPLWMTSQQNNGSTLGYTQAWVICYTKPGFSETIKNNIQTLWPYTLNTINFKIDRFSVDKTNTYDYENTFTPPAWSALPSSNPSPDPVDSRDFYVLFPRQTILPNR
jgi:hypothetical protein